MLEMAGEDGARELDGVPHDEGRPCGAPRDDGVEGRVVHEVVGLGEERRDGGAVEGLEGPRDRRRRRRRRHRRRGGRKVFDVLLKRGLERGEEAEVGERGGGQGEPHGLAELGVLGVD